MSSKEFVPEVPMIAILGRKASGKTRLIELLTKELSRQGFKVMSCKHIACSDFDFDRQGTDTWRLYSGGSCAVLAYYDEKLVMFMKMSSSPIEVISSLASFIQADVVFLEGFSRYVAENELVPKLICIRELEDIAVYKDVKKIMAFCYMGMKSIKHELSSDTCILHIPVQMRALLSMVQGYIREWKEVIRLFSQLPQANCGQCSPGLCIELAKMIVKGRASLKDCRMLHQDRLVLVHRGRRVPLNKFVEELMFDTVTAMLRNLKYVGKEINRIRIESW